MVEFHCNWFNRCPICYKCMNVDDAHYRRCQNCGFSKDRCKHTEAARNSMIKRKNFKMKLSNETKAEIKKLGEALDDTSK